MRSFVTACAAAGLLAGLLPPPPALADPCARPTEKAAFDVAGLKSELMVIAISCQAQDKYNSFVLRYQSTLRSDERYLHAYFVRTDGRYGQQRQDEYITNLANAQSEDGLQQGNQFCLQHIAMFDEVMALPDSKALPGYAESKALAQPIDLVECTSPRKKLRTASEK